MDEPTAEEPAAEEPTDDDEPRAHETGAAGALRWAEPAQGSARPEGPLTTPELFLLMHRSVTDVQLLQCALLELAAREAVAVRAVRLRRRQ